MKKQIHKVLNYVHHATDKIAVLMVIKRLTWRYIIYLRSEEHRKRVKENNQLQWWRVKMKSILLAIILFFVLLWYRADVIRDVREIINNYNFKS